MHPIERLRYVARTGGLDLGELVADAASALAGFASEPAALVTACRSLVDRHPAAGPVWWIAARCLCAADAEAEAWSSLAELETDTTHHEVLRHVPEAATVVVLGWPVSIAAGLRHRGDCRLLVVDCAGQWGWAMSRLGRSGLEVEEVPESGLGAAVAMADVVLVEAQAIGAGGLVSAAGVRAATAVARQEGVEVWAVAPLGRVLPAPLFEALAERLAASPSPWNEPDELVPLDVVDAVVRPGGLLSPSEATADDAADAPFAAELLRPLDAPGTYSR
jgi:hypothetical protein